MTHVIRTPDGFTTPDAEPVRLELTDELCREISRDTFWTPEIARERLEAGLAVYTSQYRYKVESGS